MKLKEDIKKARGLVEADLVFKNGKILDVFSGKILEGDLGVSCGKILGLGCYKSERLVDLKGKFVIPTLIDAHVHIESSMVSPLQFSKALIKNGVSTIVADPHEIANVAGLDGIDYIIKSSENLPVDIKIMLPSCVPCTDFENSGAILTYEDLEKFKKKDRVLGLGEMMDFVGLLEGSDLVLNKLEAFKDYIIDGHSPGILGNDLNAYAFAGVKTDHECSTLSEMEERISKGMYVLIREGTAAKNTRALIKGVTKDNLSRLMFCTDDKHPEDLIKNGSVNENIKIAIEEGLDPIEAIKMATINPALAYGFKNKGAIAPGYEASFIVLDTLEDFQIEDVYVKGEKFVEEGRLIREIKEENHFDSFGRVNIYDYRLEDFQIPLEGNKLLAIGVIPNELVTNKVIVEADIENGKFVASKDLLKLAVVERHKGLNSLGLGVIKGFGIKKGAMASTIAHDSHNIIIVGQNDQDMFLAMKEIERIKGGIALVKDGKLLYSLPLEIGGLMSNRSLEEVNEGIENILRLTRDELGLDIDLDPIITLGFMALPVIPSIKLTDKGLFDVEKFEFINLRVED